MHRLLPSFQPPGRCRGGDVPESDDSFRVSRCEAFAIALDGEGRHGGLARFRLEGPFDPPARGVPQQDRPIQGAEGDELALIDEDRPGRCRRTGTRSERSRVPRRRRDDLDPIAGLRSVEPPHSHPPRGRPCRQAVAVRAEGHGRDRLGLLLEHRHEPTRRRLPETDRRVVARRSDEVTVGADIHRLNRRPVAGPVVIAIRRPLSRSSTRNRSLRLNASRLPSGLK